MDESFAGKWVVGEDFHAESLADLHENLSDSACTDDTDSFSVQIEASQTAQGKS